MKRTLLAGLIVVNVLLLLGLAVKPTMAGLGGARGGNYLMTSMAIRGERFKQPVVIIDTQRGILLTVMLDPAKRLKPVTARNLGADFKAAAGGAGAGGR